MHSPSSAVNPSERVDTPAVIQGADAGAAAEMRHEHASLRDLRRRLRQDRGDVLVGKTVKAVALQPPVAEIPRQRYQVGHGAVAPMKGRVETGDLRQPRQAIEDGVNRREVERLVQRRQRRQFPEVPARSRGSRG